MTLLYSSPPVGLNPPRVLETGVDYTRNTGGPEPGDIAGKRQRTQEDVRVYPIPPMAETENPAQQQIPEERRIEQKPNDECTHGVRLTRIRINCGPMAGYRGKALVQKIGVLGGRPSVTGCSGRYSCAGTQPHMLRTLDNRGA